MRGDLHAHTTLSDGRNSLDEMAAAGRDRGYAYMAITDHSASHGFGDDVQPDAPAPSGSRRSRAWNAEHGSRRFRLLVGSEINIGLDGSLDYPDDLVAELDWVVASVHTSFNVSAKDMTARVVAAIEDPNVDCIGHLTGRLINRREPYGIDVEAVAEAAARTGTMIEINGNPNRRDLSDRHARLAADAGVRIVLNTDAHGVDTLDNMAYAVATARRAWLTKAEVANTRTWSEFKKLLQVTLGDACRRSLRRPGVRTSSIGFRRRVGDDVEADAVALLDRRAPPPRGCARRARRSGRSRCR